MKTRTTIKHTLTALVLALTIVSCKKDKTTDPVTPPVEMKTVTITELRAFSTTTSVKLPDGRKIKGIVISDAASKNIDSKTVILQEATDKPAILVTFDAAQMFAVNDELELTVSNQTLAQVNGEIVLQNIPTANAKKTGTATVAAKATTIANVVANKTVLAGTLVTIVATELSGGNGKYTGALTVKDASGTITTNVLSGATFENTAYPASISSLTGIVRLSGNDVRIEIRNAADILVGVITRTVTENFDGLSADNGNSTVKIGSWKASINGAGSAAIFKDVVGDVNSVTEAGKAYPYLYAGYGYNTAVGLNSQNLQGLKTVTVTFVYSKATSIDVPGDGIYQGGDIYTFDATKDKVQIGIAPKYVNTEANNTLYSLKNDPLTNEDQIMGLSPQYTEIGKEFTYTFTMPTDAELTAGGITEDVKTKFLANPSFSVYNKCFVNNGQYGSAPLYTIVVKKVVFGFSK